ncbi:recombinase family protein [Fluoribacter dumoffii]|uniref:Resolvase/invertase-type recombinase catalytic domain-containing protein n=1 Tax=Fluoribacter dumoffii TaxID=463 RepID=A0A377G9F8_9GAMM|nr:recombinase family protein [Fluoribacter dumoffii]KTC90317.1 hypothetical protein Ldum_1385 [Fluoribacter dumoffii NY 23]MCW8453493.1 recombinase family protein [Fluoribacter dumoffii]MCW8496070.1 recombinase family protein [Fluoribacter dumoffii]STO21437.1 Uncharacterised protein [Fluoribacter dumoffii]
MAIFAEFEREILRERVKAGIAHARSNGKLYSRPATAKNIKMRLLNCLESNSIRNC